MTTMSKEAAEEFAQAISTALTTSTTEVATTVDLIQFGCIGALFALSVVCLVKSRASLKTIIKEINSVQLKK